MIPALGRRDMGPALRRRDMDPALGRKDKIVSPLPRSGEVARVPLAGAGRVRAARLRVAQGVCPLIRPSATFSRVGEKGHGSRVGGEGTWFPRCGEGTRSCHLSRGRERSLGSRLREPGG